MTRDCALLIRSRSDGYVPSGGYGRFGLMSPQTRRAAELQSRLIRFGLGVCRETATRHPDYAAAHIASQLIRSATSPAANYAEACGAQSRREFAHKLRICLKELRETAVWLRFIGELLGDTSARASLSAECDELISIFVASLKTLGPQVDD
jgi:four helix bundle protein